MKSEKELKGLLYQIQNWQSKYSKGLPCLMWIVFILIVTFLFMVMYLFPLSK